MSARFLAADVASDADYRGEWGPLEADPGRLVFLLGCQRSGTTWFHLQLARTGAFRYLTAHDVYAGDTFVHNWRHGHSAASRRAFERQFAGRDRDRGIDTIPADADTPEEYGLVIASPPDGLRYDRPDTTEATLPKLRELCAKKALVEGRDRPLLLKSPPDYPSGATCLAAAWPDAKFVVLQRHPLRTLQSQVNAWRKMVLHRNTYLNAIDASYRALFEDSARRLALGLFMHSQAGVDWLADCILRAHTGFLSLGADWSANISTIRYEDFCRNQGLIFRQLASFLQVDLPAPQDPPSPRDGPLSQEVRRSFEDRRSAFAPFLERYGYSAEPE